MEKTKISGGYVPEIIESDTTFQNQQSYGTGTAIYIKNGAKVVWENGAKFLNNCKLIIESGSADLALFVIHGINKENGGTFILQLKREKYRKDGTTFIKEKEEYVQIPVCGCHVFYDNGLSVNGFKWGPHWELSGSYTMKDCGISGEIYSASCHGRNIEVCATYFPESLYPSQVNGWQTGDRIINVGESTTWNMKVIKIKK